MNKSSVRLTRDMDINEITRWYCLIEAINVADTQMRELNVDPEECDWVRPIAFEHYIHERFHSMKHDLLWEMKNGIPVPREEDEFFHG